MDGTFKMARKPFQQLFTIHSFMSPGKAVPAVFVVMSRRTEHDYVQVESEVDYYCFVTGVND